MYGDLAMAFLKHLRNQDLWTEHTTQSLPSIKPEAEKHRNDPKKTHIHEATHLCVQTNGGPCQGDHHMKAMRWALLGFDGSEEQTERKNKGGDEKKSPWEVGKRRYNRLNSVLQQNSYVPIPNTPECD